MNLMIPECLMKFFLVINSYNCDAEPSKWSSAAPDGIQVKCLEVQCPFLTVSGEHYGKESNGNYKFAMDVWVRKFPEKPVYKHENHSNDRYINWKDQEGGFWSIGTESMINLDYTYKHRSIFIR